MRISGKLTDNYNPTTKTLSLSDEVYNGISVASVGIAAHECGHAIQHAENYIPVKLRSALVPVTNLASNICWILIYAGIFIPTMSTLAYVGLVLYSFTALFALVTLPVEFNASRRAVKIIKSDFSVDTDEISGIKRVLGAAAMTYVSALFASVISVLRIFFIIRGRND